MQRRRDGSSRGLAAGGRLAGNSGQYGQPAEGSTPRLLLQRRQRQGFNRAPFHVALQASKAAASTGRRMSPQPPAAPAPGFPRGWRG